MGRKRTGAAAVEESLATGPATGSADFFLGPGRKSETKPEREARSVASKPLELTLDDTLSVDTFVSKYPADDRLVRDLRALLEISTAINSIREVEALERELLQAIFVVIPAQRGAILQLESDGKGIASVFGADRSAGSKSPVEVSRTIMKRVTWRYFRVYR